MRLKKIVACTVAATMVLGSLSMVSAANVTTSTDYAGGQVIDGSSGWNTYAGDSYLITSDYETVVSFTCTPFIRDTNNWSNFVFETVSSEAADGITLRADAYGWTYTYVENVSVNTPSYNVTYDWTIQVDTDEYGNDVISFPTFYDICKDNTSITLTALQTSDTTVTFTIVWGDAVATEVYTVTYADGVPDDLYFHMGADGASITVNSVEYVRGITTTESTIYMTVDATRDASQYVAYTPASLADGATLSYEVTEGEGVISIAEDGTITALAKGDAVIEINCTDTDGNAYTTQLNVSVTDPNSVTGISSAITEATMTVGNTMTVSPVLEAEKSGSPITDEYTISYASDDETVATIADGVITAVGTGTANITMTVTGTDTNGIAYEHSTTIALTVSEAATTGTTEEESEEESEEPTEEEEPEETTVTMDEQTITGDGNYWSVSTEHLQAQSKTAVWTFTVTVDALSDEYDNVIGLELQDADSQYISTGSNGDNWYYNTEGDDIVMDGAAFDLVAGQTYTITVERDGADITISYCDADGNVLLSYYCANTSLVSTVDAYVYAQGGVTLTVSGECTYGAASSGDENESEEESEEAGSTTDSSTTGPQTGDVLPIVAVLVALCGCAIILVASKKRRA